MQYPTGAFGHSLGPVVLGMVQRLAPMMVMLHEFTAAHPVRKAAVGALLLGADRISVVAERGEQTSEPLLSLAARADPHRADRFQYSGSALGTGPTTESGVFRPATARKGYRGLYRKP